MLSFEELVGAYRRFSKTRNTTIQLLASVGSPTLYPFLCLEWREYGRSYPRVLGEYDLALMSDFIPNSALDIEKYEQDRTKSRTFFEENGVSFTNPYCALDRSLSLLRCSVHIEEARAFSILLEKIYRLGIYIEVVADGMDSGGIVFFPSRVCVANNLKEKILCVHDIRSLLGESVPEGGVFRDNLIKMRAYAERILSPLYSLS